MLSLFLASISLILAKSPLLAIISLDFNENIATIKLSVINKGLFTAYKKTERKSLEI